MPASFAPLASRRLAAAAAARPSCCCSATPPLLRSAAAAARRPKTTTKATTICSASAAAGGNNQVVPGLNASAPVTDDAVPEAHKGLHASLYGDGDAEDAHGGSAAKSGSGIGGGDGPYRARPEDDGSAVVALEAWLSEREGSDSSNPSPPQPVPGVYAIFDSASKLQHVGYARDAVRAVRAAREAVGARRASSIRARLFAPGRGKMVGRAELSALAAAWLAEEAAAASPDSPPPPGNTSAEAALWAGGGGGVAAASAAPSSSSSLAEAPPSSAPSSPAADETSVVVAPATAARGMTAAQAALHAERKDKLEKAMGVKKEEEEEEEPRAEAAREAALSPEERRQKLRNAVEGGDWSAVIEGQTRETLPVAPGRTSDTAKPAANAPVAAAAAAAQQQGQNRPVTPFARASVHRSVGGGTSPPSPSSSPSAAAEGSGSEEPFVLTVEAAEAALDEVRPYLIADGGNVEVVEVVAEGEENEAADGTLPPASKSYVVRVALQGACGTCGSASATMAMGIERALKATFGAAVARVERVDNSYGMAEAEAADKAAAGGSAAGVASVSVDAIDGLLDGLRPAIAAYQGSVEVVSVSPDTLVATLRYSGPDSIGVGIVMAVRDRFPGLSDVKLISG